MIKALTYSIGIIVIVFLSNYVYVHFGFYDDDIKKCNAELMYEIDSLKNKASILYFGESSNFTSPDNDTCKLSIAELIAQMQQPDQTLKGISKGAIHASTFKTLINRISKESTVKTVIVTMNLRSFGINWIQSDLETNLSRADILYSNYFPILKKFLLSFKGYDNVPVFKRKEIIKSHYKNDTFKLTNKEFTSVYEWDKYVFDKGVPDKKRNKDQEKTDIACHFIKNYAFVIDENNPRIKDFDAIVKLCQEKKLQLIFHILSENYERASELCGSDLTDLMKKNIQFLQNRYTKESIFINNYDLLPDSIFIDRQWPTEHYSFIGRYSIARRINERLNVK